MERGLISLVIQANGVPWIVVNDLSRPDCGAVSEGMVKGLTINAVLGHLLAAVAGENESAGAGFKWTTMRAKQLSSDFQKDVSYLLIHNIYYKYYTI